MKLDDIDVILTRNTIRSLLSFVKTGIKRSVAMQMHLINNTLIIAADEEKNRRYNDPRKRPNWGHAFEDAFTSYSAELRDSISHHRVIKYKLGSVTVAVCHEADASYSQLPQGPQHPAYQERGSSFGNIKPSAGLRRRYEQLSTDGLTKVRLAGAGTFPSEMAELKASCFFQSIGTHMNQLWFGRTSYIITGKHAEGNFQECGIVNAESEFSIWEERHQEALQKLDSLIMILRERVGSLGGQGVGIINKSRSKTILEIWTAQKKTEPLSVEFIERHWSQIETGRFSVQFGSNMTRQD
ncbi:geranylgeranyl pyrophosphate synthetase [Colletotrichum karsti]|uniref:Geranylgeranyl pyrophosphate synthetase n=1 Tax=Colletotrichum karsti TaxID=1095194 RepID=A0A9P6LJ98_9PEZI|nr:geranylgeranyl pyrophosphate synthetase [Colletotrichum karsti]KAF9874590.1 geranylgeranyl pyrophosphate synthetase [Colletotrichum karsti]